MKYDAVIFDLFGTLVDNPTYLEDRVAESRRMMGDMAAALGIELANFRRWWSATEHERSTGLFPTMEAYLEHLCRQSGIGPNPERIAPAARIRIEYVRRVLTPRDDTLGTLRRLRVAGYKIGLVSDCAIEDAILWPSTTISPLVDVAILSCEVGLRKPDPRIYQMVCDRLKVAPDRCLYVGDGGSRELTGAAESGMDVVLIRAPYDTINGDREEWRGARIAELKQVLDLVY